MLLPQDNVRKNEYIIVLPHPFCSFCSRRLTWICLRLTLRSSASLYCLSNYLPLHHQDSGLIGDQQGHEVLLNATCVYDTLALLS